MFIKIIADNLSWLQNYTIHTRKSL